MVEIYCDGSKKDDSATIGIYCKLEDGDYFEMMEYVGNLASTTAEVIAIVRALELAVSIGKDAIIFTEMEDIIRQCRTDRYKILNSARSPNRLKRMMAVILWHLLEYPGITLRYIKAHSSDLYNCRADRLAKAGHVMVWPLIFEQYKKNFIGYDGIVSIESNKMNRFYSQAFYMHMRNG
jgi:ribonuclease HI